MAIESLLPDWQSQPFAWTSSHSSPSLLSELRVALPSWLQKIGITGAVVALVITYWCWQVLYALYFSPLKHIPGPLAARLSGKRGTLHILSGKAAEMAEADYLAHGDVYLAKPNAVFLCDPDDARKVLAMGEFRKTDMYRIFEYEGVPNVSTLIEPVDANRRRRQLHPFFAYSYLAKMESHIIRHGFANLKKRWNAMIEANSAKGEPTIVNYRLDTQLAMFDITGALVFGRDFDALETNNLDYTSWVNNTLTYMLMAHYFPAIKRWPFSILARRLRRSYDSLVEFSKESVAIRRKLLDSGAEKPADLLQALIDSEDPDSKIRMTPEEVQAESIAMLVGGSESTSSVISWVIHFLMLYPADFKRVVDEVRSKFPSDHVVTHAECREDLPYLEACIYETLRCIPTASTSFPRIADNRGITIKGYYIPPGVEIVTNKCAAHIHKGSWEDPYDFKPSRFIDNNEAKRNMLSFAYGTRVCIGKNLAWVVMIVTLANLFKDFDVALPEDSIFRPENVDANGRPKIMPTKLGVATMPANPERDCRMILSKRVE
ncbi:putative cytochrome P450 monooxygenase [Xylariaceae sp. FL0594]|nr:putative cytochrome P450 monooxygenase [Xylariaceae sp. FL0594]